MLQTPIYDQLWGELINADVSPSDVDSDRLGHCGRHRLGADAPCGTVVVLPVRPRTDDVTGHHRRVQASPTAGLSGDELGTAGDDFPAAVAAEAGVRSAPRHAAVIAATVSSGRIPGRNQGAATTPAPRPAEWDVR